MSVEAPANKLVPIPKRSEEIKGKLRIEIKMKENVVRKEMETSKVIRIAKLTYALKLILIPDFRKFLSMSLNRGKNRAVFSPTTR